MPEQSWQTWLESGDKWTRIENLLIDQRILNNWFKWWESSKGPLSSALLWKDLKHSVANSLKYVSFEFPHRNQHFVAFVFLPFNQRFETFFMQRKQYWSDLQTIDIYEVLKGQFWWSILTSKHKKGSKSSIEGEKINVARFVREVVKWDFFCDFQTPW